MLHVLRIVLIITLCLWVNLAAAQDDAGFPRTVIDDRGAVVTIPEYPVCVAVIGVVPALDVILLPDAVARIDPAADPGVVDWGAQQVGLLVLPELYAAAYPVWIEAAALADVPVYQAATITSVDAWQDVVRRLGAATGREIAARVAVMRLDVTAWGVRVWLGDRDPVRVLVLTPEAYTVGQGALLTDLIALAGGINVAAEAGYADIRQIDDAAIRALAPDVILLTPAWSAEGRAALLDNPAYAQIPAVAAGRVHVLPFDAARIGHPAAAVIALVMLLWR